jgi:hypothetical protein
MSPSARLSLPPDKMGETPFFTFYRQFDCVRPINRSVSLVTRLLNANKKQCATLIAAISKMKSSNQEQRVTYCKKITYERGLNQSVARPKAQMTD